MDCFSASSRTKCKGIERLALFTTVQTLISAFCRFARLPWALHSKHHSGANVVLTSTFLCKSVLKTIGLGPRTFARMHIFDLVIVLFAILDVVLDIVLARMNKVFG